jgi:hypothetical protein
MSLFTVNIVADDKECEVGYDSITELLDDVGMKALFDNKLITKCTVYANNKRITGLPIMEWERLVDGVVSNSTIILRGKK